MSVLRPGTRTLLCCDYLARVAKFSLKIRLWRTNEVTGLGFRSKVIRAAWLWRKYQNVAMGFMACHGSWIFRIHSFQRGAQKPGVFSYWCLDLQKTCIVWDFLPFEDHILVEITFSSPYAPVWAVLSPKVSMFSPRPRTRASLHLRNIKEARHSAFEVLRALLAWHCQENKFGKPLNLSLLKIVFLNHMLLNVRYCYIFSFVPQYLLKNLPTATWKKKSWSL